MSISRRRAIAILALTSVLLITLDLRGNGIIDSVRGGFATVFEPVRDAAEVVTRPVVNTWHGITGYDDLREENERLQEELDRQRGAAIAAEAAVVESQELLALNGLPTLAGIDRVTAQVVGVSPSNFSQTVEINQGSKQGIKVGMPVLNAAGLIGKVHKVYPDRSVVMLMTDPEFAISARVGVPPATDASAPTPDTAPNGLPPGGTSTTVPPTTTLPGEAPGTTTTTLPPGVQPGNPLGQPATVPTTTPAVTTTLPDLQNLTPRETGLLVGRGPVRRPAVTLIEPNPRFGELAEGAWVVTAGGETSVAPPNIVIGEVIKVIERAGSAGPLLEVRPNADLDDLNFVVVLLYQPATEAPGGG